MSYKKTTWVDHLKSSNAFNISQNADGTYNITPAGNVVQQGTPMSAENLNHIEDGIVDVNQQCAIDRTTLGCQSKNLFNETEYLSSIASVSIGTFNISGNSITLTATGKDCYTKPHASGDGGYRIPVTPDTDYILSWESDNSNDGYVYAFMNGSLSQQKLANNKDTKYFKFTTNSNTTFITIRLGVSNSGDSITYSNIMLRYADITDDTYEPYQPSLQEQISALIARIEALENK